MCFLSPFLYLPPTDMLFTCEGFRELQQTYSLAYSLTDILVLWKSSRFFIIEISKSHHNTPSDEHLNALSTLFALRHISPNKRSRMCFLTRQVFIFVLPTWPLFFRTAALFDRNVIISSSISTPRLVPIDPHTPTPRTIIPAELRCSAFTRNETPSRRGVERYVLIFPSRTSRS